MTKLILRCICLCVFVFGCRIAMADAPKTSKTETINLLSEGKYADLEQRFAAVQQAYKHGLLSDEQLLDAFRAFYETDPGLEPRLSQWIALHPKSYVAYLARGIYYKYVGFEKRGYNYINETTDEQLAGMEASFRNAMQDLRQSMTLDDKPLLSYLHAMDIGKNFGLKDMNRRLLNMSSKIEPKNFIVRRKYMYTLETRWGGSVKEMTEFLNECKGIGLTDANIRELEAIVVADTGWNQQQNGDYTEAEQTYSTALTVLKGNVHVMKEKSWTLMKQQKYQEAISVLTAIIEISPKDKYALANRGVGYMNLHKTKEAVADYVNAAELGDAFCQNELGKLYWRGGILRKDADVAIKWFRKAAAQGHAEAQQNLKKILSEM